MLPGRVDHMTEIQKILEDPQLKYCEVHAIRWLSFWKALEAIYRTLDSLITYFESQAEKMQLLKAY